jgi:hypothetical protein
MENLNTINLFSVTEPKKKKNKKKRVKKIIKKYEYKMYPVQ